MNKSAHGGRQQVTSQSLWVLPAPSARSPVEGRSVQTPCSQWALPLLGSKFHGAETWFSARRASCISQKRTNQTARPRGGHSPPPLFQGGWKGDPQRNEAHRQRARHPPTTHSRLLKTRGLWRGTNRDRGSQQYRGEEGGPVGVWPCARPCALVFRLKRQHPHSSLLLPPGSTPLPPGEA